MKNTLFDTRASQWIGDLADWQQKHQGDNAEQRERLLRNLRLARETELTVYQQRLLAMYFDEGKSMSQIGRELGVSCSAVSRALLRARKTLRRCLRYSF